MKKLNQFLSFTVIVFLFTSSFLIGCSERDREMRFPHTDIPESVTVMVKDVPEGSRFDLTISSDYSKHKDNLGSTVIIYNISEKYTVTQNFNKTFPLEAEEPTIDLNLICTYVGPTSEDSSNSFHLIIRFNGDGNFYRGNHNDVLPLEVGTTINVRSRFSRYDGTSKSVSSFEPDGS